MNGSPGDGPGPLRFPVTSWERGAGNAEGAIAVTGLSPAEVIGLTPETDGRLVCLAVRGARRRCERRNARGGTWVVRRFVGVVLAQKAYIPTRKCYHVDAYSVRASAWNCLHFSLVLGANRAFGIAEVSWSEFGANWNVSLRAASAYAPCDSCGTLIPTLLVRKPAQRAMRASRTVEVGGGALGLRRAPGGNGLYGVPGRRPGNLERGRWR